MNYWLVKFAPFRCGWQDVFRNGKFEIYSVHNAKARKHLKDMKSGDEMLFYQSQQSNNIMGITKVVEEARQDKTTDDARWISVGFEPVLSFSTPISLKALKKTKRLAKSD